MAAVMGNGSFTINEWRVDPSLNRISRGEDIVKVDPQNMKVLELLASRPGEVFSQAEIEQSAWPNVVVTPNSVYQSIANLRRAFGDDKQNPKYIETIARKGYRCIADITVIRESPNSEQTSARSPHRVALSVFAVALVSIGACLVVWNQDSPNNDAQHFEVLAEAPHLSEDSDLARTVVATQLGDAAASHRQPEKALHHYNVALSHARKIAADANPLVAEVLIKIARVHSSLDQLQLALAAVREALEILRTSAPPLNPEWTEAHDVLAEVLSSMGEHPEAITSALKSVSLSEVLYGVDALDTLHRRITLARTMLDAGQASDAEILTRRILQTFLELHANSDKEVTAYLTTMLARALYEQGRFQESMLEAQRSVAILATPSRPNDPHLGAALQYLADAQLRLGKVADAENAARKSIRILHANETAPWRIARAMSTLGEALLMQGMTAEAEQRIRYAAQVLNKNGQTLERVAWLENERRLKMLH